MCFFPILFVCELSIPDVLAYSNTNQGIPFIQWPTFFA